MEAAGGDHQGFHEAGRQPAQSMAQRDGCLMIVDHDITPVCVTSGFVIG
jgi:hypothetical protein